MGPGFLCVLATAMAAKSRSRNFAAAVADSVAIYKGSALVESALNGDKAPPVLCRLGSGAAPLLLAASEDASGEGPGLLCVASAGGRLSFYGLEEAVDQGKEREVYRAEIEGEEAVEVKWRIWDVVVVCDSGRVFLIEPLKNSLACVHEIVDFVAFTVATDGASDIVLLGGAPASESAETSSTVWRLDIGVSEASPMFIEGVPEDYEESIAQAYCRGLQALRGVVGKSSSNSGANWDTDGVDIVCFFIQDMEEEITQTIQVVLTVAVGAQSATLKALSVNEIYFEEHPDRLLVHTAWLPDWSLLVLGASGSSDLALFSSHADHTEGMEAGWVALAPPEGKQLVCPQADSQDQITALRGLAF
eukprot:CAMPEP_0115272866 /NCGR_PEP_ID=MMETSP0270-20121206/54847_1 /TAXON_ID=71861 /ORGANISM="Scrippsiella trochoidea, Strain CCMP3099" /LENGTH=360 /DNA_ID=CAMNT_0002689293 /DNA_START=56 /DNA_END=1135 /DNA_ORIENTATION=-